MATSGAATAGRPVTVHDAYIPVIDIGRTTARNTTRRSAVAYAMAEACAKSGLLVIVGHGVPAATTEAAYRVVKGFFAQPEEVKQTVAADPADPLLRGYLPGAWHQQFSANRLDAAAVPAGGRLRRLTGSNRWPAWSGFRQAYLAYYAAIEALAADLMRLFALALHLPEEWFASSFLNHMSPLTANYYSAQPVPPPSGSLRNQEHRDWSGLTILYQDDAPGGLQAHHPTGQWVDVPPVPGSFVLNLGRLMTMWTNDRWGSTLHRVVNPPHEHAMHDRLSLAFFYHPSPDAVVKPVPTCVGDDRPANYPPVVSGEYFIRMFRRSHVGRVLARPTRTGATSSADPG